MKHTAEPIPFLTMTPIFQTPDHPRGGNCLQACIASLLDRPLESVPNFPDLIDDDQVDSMLPKMVDWCRRQNVGIAYIDVSGREEVWPVLDGFYLIACGKTKRSDYMNHAVIIRPWLVDGRTELEPVHDPCPDGKFLTKVEYLFLLLPEILPQTRLQNA